jgi:secreted Zn-dependent insulinase-like peptidase
LKSLNYAEELYTEVFGSFKTICDLVCVEITLTELGFLNYVRVLSLLTDYIKQATGWLSEELSVFSETKTMGELSFRYAYKVPDQMDNVCELATSLIFSENIS